MRLWTSPKTAPAPQTSSTTGKSPCPTTTSGAVLRQNDGDDAKTLVINIKASCEAAAPGTGGAVATDFMAYPVDELGTVDVIFFGRAWRVGKGM